MAEETENVGGISIGVSIDDSTAEAQLNAFLNRLTQIAQQRAIPVQIAIQQPTATAQRAQQQSTQLTFGAAARGGASAREATGLERAIAEALAKEGQQTADATTTALTKGRQSANLTIEQALTQAVGGQAPTAIPVQADFTEFREEFGAFLGELRGLVAEASKIATVPVTAAGAAGGGGGRRRKNILAAADDDDERQQRIQYVPRTARSDAEAEAFAAQRARQLAGRRAFQESERARQQELVDTGRQYDRLASLATQFFNEQERRTPVASDQDRALRELSFEAQREGGAGRTSATVVGRQRTPEEIAALRTQEARTANARAAQPRTGPTPEQRAELEARRARASTISGRESREIDETAAFESGRRIGVARSRGVAAGRAQGQTSEDLERRATEQIATSEAQRLTAARTARTFASGLGGFFLGQTRQQTEASIGLRRAEQELTIARRRLNDPSQITTVRAYRQAQEEVAVAEGNVATALEKVQSFTTPFAAARTLASVTIAGAAFGLGLKAVDVGLQSAGRALDPYLQGLTGYIQISQQLTNELSDQARAQQGNVVGVVAQRAAVAGLADSTARSISPIIEQRTQIEAGNKAITEQIALIRSAEQIASQGPGAGLGTTTGGILGTPIFGIPSTGEQIGGFLSELARGIRGPTEVGQRQFVTTTGFRGVGGFAPAGEEAVAATLAAQDRFAKGLEYVNEQLGKGGFGVGQFSQDLSRTNPQIERTAQAFDGLSPQMAAAIRQAGLYSDEINSINDAMRALSAINFAGTLPDPAQVGRQALAAEQVRQRASAASLDAIRAQQAFERPAIRAAAERQQQFQLQVQLPAEATLQRLAAPPTPIGTGIVAANAEEQERIVAGQQRSIELQDQLNTYYDQGRQILLDTYKVPPGLLNQVTSIGQEIANLSAGIANQQAQYQVAQYNFQLHIARRTLADIGGLTGQNFGAGQSYLGVLERQNLALSRQAQLLNFALAQRQINFQQAVAGFAAPGITPEERQANIKQAQIEAEFAQKQLDIQREMFGNQVQIVDIQNLRQGADLAAQIGLLLQGRQLTIDTALAQEQLARLQSQQAILVGQVGTYLTKTNNLTAVAFGQIQQLEAAAGRAMYNTAYSVLDSFGIVLTGLSNQLSAIGGGGGGGRPPLVTASGAVGLTTTTTPIVTGEAGREHVTVLRNPRGMSSLEGLGGVTNNTINFGDVYVRDENDIQRIAAAVMQAMGVRASLAGLRLTG